MAIPHSAAAAPIQWSRANINPSPAGTKLGSDAPILPRARRPRIEHGQAVERGYWPLLSEQHKLREIRCEGQSVMFVYVERE